MSGITVKILKRPSFHEREALRYAGCTDASEDMLELLAKTIEEADKKLVYKVCFGEFPINTDGDVCDFGSFKVRSGNLSKNLEGCSAVLLFAATVGVEIDRLIARYGRISPSRAVMLQAIGAERIEALCDTFCKEYEEENSVKLKPRFSPGYGDLPLETQKDIFAVLECPLRIGLSLNNSLLMSPSKSVTAFAGIIDSQEK